MAILKRGSGRIKMMNYATVYDVVLSHRDNISNPNTDIKVIVYVYVTTNYPSRIPYKWNIISYRWNIIYKLSRIKCVYDVNMRKLKPMAISTLQDLYKYKDWLNTSNKIPEKKINSFNFPNKKELLSSINKTIKRIISRI